MSTDQAEQLSRLMHTSVLRHHPHADHEDLVEVQWDELEQPVRDAYLAVAGDVLVALAPAGDGDHAVVADIPLREHTLGELGLNDNGPAPDWSGVVPADRGRVVGDVAAILRRSTADTAEDVAVDLLDDLASGGYRVVTGWLPGELDEAERFPVGDDVAGQAR